MPTTLPLAIDKASPVPVYHQLAQALEVAIRSGVLEPGVKLDSETNLATRLRITRSTVSKALNRLVGAGLLVRKQGDGTYVTAPNQPGRLSQTNPRPFRNRRPDKR